MSLRSVLMISLDTFRADVAYAGTLPQLTRLLARGTSFHQAVASSPVTPVSHTTVFTGLQPYHHGVRHLFKEQWRQSVPTLAQLFAAKGYRTGAVVSCPGLNRWYGLDVGFSHYDDEIPRLPDGTDPLQTVDVELRGTALKRAPVVVERVLDWLDGHREEPFFLFLHFFDTHWPYEPPEWLAPEDANPYEAEAHFVDHHLGVVLDQVERWGLFDNTLLVVFGDHGEDLNGWYANDHGGEDLGHPEEKGHGCLLFDATQRVPLALIAPEGVPAGKVVDQQVRLTDVLPTVVDLAELSDPHQREGESLVEFLNGEGRHRPAYFESYYRTESKIPDRNGQPMGPWSGFRLDASRKMVTDLRSSTTAVYDLIADPNECRPELFGPGRWGSARVAF